MFGKAEQKIKISRSMEKNFFCLLFTIKLLGKAVRGRGETKTAPNIYLNCMQTINISLKPTKNNIPNFFLLFTLLKSGVASEQANTDIVCRFYANVSFECESFAPKN